MASDASEHAPIDPDAILRQPFSTVRKGYDPLEVQKYLMAVAGELRAGRERERHLERRLNDSARRADDLENMSPQRLTALLGEETAKVIEAANSAAIDIRTKAEENVARLLRDAQDQAGRMRREAEAVLERKTTAAEEAAAAIQSQADELLQQARIDADAEAEAGRQRGREMVTEAQRVRERMLRDLARRRKTLRQQIEQLQAGRERLIEAFAVVRQTLDVATNELDVVLPEAKAAADLALQRAIESTDDALEDDMAELSAEVDASHSKAGEPATENGSRPEQTSTTPPREAQQLDEDDLELIEETLEVDLTDEPRAPDPVAGRHSSAVNVIVPPAPTATAKVEAEPVAEPEAEAEPVAAAEPEPLPAAPAPAPTAALDPDPSSTAAPVASVEAVEPDPDGTFGSSARVASLFVRIKAEATTEEAHGEAAARVIPTEPTPDEVGAAAVDLGGLSLPDRCARVLRELERGLARHVKRELSDEQNELLDTVRREKSAPTAAALLPDPEDHVERYANAAFASLSDAAIAGSELLPGSARFAGDPPRVGGLARDIAAELAAELVAPLRERLETSFAEGEANDQDEDADLSEAVRTCYREWRTQRVDALVVHGVVTAFNRGVLAAVEPGVPLRWLVDAADAGCEVCAQNAHAAGSPAGEPFPTGHTAPPIHDECRCVLVVEE